MNRPLIYLHSGGSIITAATGDAVAPFDIADLITSHEADAEKLTAHGRHERALWWLWAARDLRVASAKAERWGGRRTLRRLGWRCDEAADRGADTGPDAQLGHS